jgi:tetratricopeptide (TPR) repeat protein
MVNQHSIYYLDYIQQRSPDKERNQIVSLNEIETEIANIRQAWQQATNRSKVKALQQAAPSLFWFYELRGRFREAFELFGQTAATFEDLLSQSDTGVDPGPNNLIRQVYGEVVMWQSWFCLRLGRFKATQELLNRAPSISEALISTDYWYKAFPLYQQGLLSWYLGNYQVAEQYFEQGLSICSKENTLVVRSVILCHLGLTALALGNHLEARQWHIESLTIAKKLSEQSIFGRQHILLGWVAYTHGNYLEAERLIDEGLKICRDVQHLFSIALGLVYGGLAGWRLGEISQGKKLCLEGLKVFNQIEDRFGQTLALDHLGQITWATGDYNESKQYFLDALCISTVIGLPPRMLAALVGLAKHLNRESNTLKALDLVTLVAHHPASEHMVKEEAQQVIAELSAKLGPAAVDEALKNSARQDLEAIARNLLTPGTNTPRRK